MAQINYANYMASLNNNNSASGNGNYVGYFFLKDDGDEAVVRIMHDSVDSFDIVTTHQIKVDNKFKRVSCLRNPYDPVSACPFCEKGQAIQQRFYIRLIEYSRDESGNIVASPKVWERAASYAQNIKNLIDEYGPLSDQVFKIHRNGKAGSMDTTYSILYANPTVYKPELYPKNTSLFDGYNVLGYTVLSKSFEDLSYFLANGSFPNSNNNQSSAAPVYTPATAQPVGNTSSTNYPATEASHGSAHSQPASQPETPQVSTPSGNVNAPWMQNSQTMSRPTRYY